MIVKYVYIIVLLIIWICFLISEIRGLNRSRQFLKKKCYELIEENVRLAHKIYDFEKELKSLASGGNNEQERID